MLYTLYIFYILYLLSIYQPITMLLDGACGPRSGAGRFGGPERAKIDPSRLDSRSDRPFRPTKSPQERSKRPLRSTFSTQVARKGLRKAILDALGSILGPPEGRFWRFFGGFPLEWADSLEAEATFEKPAKTTVKPGFLHIRSFREATARACKKTIKNHPWRLRKPPRRGSKPPKIELGPVPNAKKTAENANKKLRNAQQNLKNTQEALKSEK